MKNLIDYNLDNFCNKDIDCAFAIEPEISEEFYYHKLSDYEAKSESSTIKELNDLHNLNLERRMRAYHIIQDFYKDKFPVGSDNHLSWGTHFVIFWDQSRFSSLWSKINTILLNCPLHLKYEQGKAFWRKNQRHTFTTSISTDSKSSAVSLKSELMSSNWVAKYSPIEFRCNNVFDARMYGYYAGLLIAAEKGVRFKKSSDSLREYMKKWEPSYFSAYEDVELSYISGYTLSDDDKKTLRANSEKILKVLEDEGLVKASEALREYLVEVEILDNNITM